MKKIGYIEPASYFPKPAKLKKTAKTQSQNKSTKEKDTKKK